MESKEFLLFLVVNCAFIFSTTCARKQDYLTSVILDGLGINPQSLSETTIPGNGIDDEMHLFYYNKGGIFYDDGHSNGSVIQIRSSDVKVQALDYHASTQTVYWTKPDKIGKSASKLFAMIWNPRACDLDSTCRVTGRFSNPRVHLLREDDWNARSLAVDHIGNKLYIVDTFDESVNVLDLKGENKATVFKNETLIPFEVALDSMMGLMFILVANKRLLVSQIYRVNMDGSMPQLIVNKTDSLERFRSSKRLGFALDTRKKRIYFENSEEGKIETVNYLGNGRLTVINATKPKSIGVYRDNLYYYNDELDEDFVDDDERYFRSCKIDEHGACIKNSNATICCFKFRSRSYGIKPISSYLQPRTLNPCEINNGGCQHHCLLKPTFDNSTYSLTSSCVCYNGYRLEADFKNCTLEEVSSELIGREFATLNK